MGGHLVDGEDDDAWSGPGMVSGKPPRVFLRPSGQVLISASTWVVTTSKTMSTRVRVSWPEASMETMERPQPGAHR